VRPIQGRHLLAGLAAAGALLALPAGAMAGTKSKSATLSSVGQIASLSPKCPKGQKATGGGFKIAPAGTSEVSIYESRKSGQRRWRVSAQEPAVAAVRTLTAYVYCSADAPKTKESAATVTAPLSLAYVNGDAKCSSGKARAGGFLFPPPATTLLFQSDSFRLDSKTWRTGARNPGGPTASFTSYVYCASGKPKARSGSTSVPTDSTPGTAVSAACKSGTKLLAGGFSQPGVNAMVYYFPISESFKTGKSWRVSALHLAAPAGPSTLTSYAYCG
jgi:hypothetical protein